MTDADAERYWREHLYGYLDWPVQVDDDWAICVKPGCPACGGRIAVGITKWYGLTPRRLCEAIKRHAGSDHRA